MTIVKTIDAKTLHDWVEKDNVVIIDVREQEEYDEEHIPGSHLFPLSSLDVSQLPKPQTKKLVIHCRGGIRSHKACQSFLASFSDLEVYNLEGGISAWKSAGYPTKS